MCKVGEVLLLSDFPSVIGFVKLSLTNFQYFIFSGLKEAGYLVEATLFVEECNMRRGDLWTYWYGVKQRQKEMNGIATRYIQIPWDPNIKGETSKPMG